MKKNILALVISLSIASGSCAMDMIRYMRNLHQATNEEEANQAQPIVESVQSNGWCGIQ